MPMVSSGSEIRGSNRRNINKRKRLKLFLCINLVPFSRIA